MNWIKLGGTAVLSVLAAILSVCIIGLIVAILTLAQRVAGEAGVTVVLVLMISALIAPHIYRSMRK